MSKPSTVPSWSATGPITVPSSGKKAAGWAPAERGAAQYFNWLFNLIGLWLTWLSTSAFVQTVTLSVPVVGFRSQNSPIGLGDGGSMTGLGVTYLSFPVAIPVGVTITAIRMRAMDNNVGPGTAVLYKYRDGVQTAIATAATPGVSFAYVTTTASGLTEVVAATTTYGFICNNTSGDPVTVTALEIDYTPVNPA